MLISRRRFFPVSVLCWLCPLSPAGAEAGADPQKGVKSGQAHALISGTVFREPGFSLGGAEIELQPDPKGNTSVKVKKMKAVCDSRGEFAFRVPAAAMSYTLSFRAKGFQPEQRPVTISGEERQDVFVTLKAREGSQ